MEFYFKFEFEPRMHNRHYVYFDLMRLQHHIVTWPHEFVCRKSLPFYYLGELYAATKPALLSWGGDPSEARCLYDRAKRGSLHQGGLGGGGL